MADHVLEMKKKNRQCTAKQVAYNKNFTATSPDNSDRCRTFNLQGQDLPNNFGKNMCA